LPIEVYFTRIVFLTQWGISNSRFLKQLEDLFDTFEHCCCFHFLEDIDIF